MKLNILAFLIILGNSIFFSCEFQKKNESKQFSQELGKETNSTSDIVVMEDLILSVTLDKTINSITILNIDGSRVKTIKQEQGDLNKIDISFLKPREYEVIVMTSYGSQFSKHIEIEK